MMHSCRKNHQEKSLPKRMVFLAAAAEKAPQKESREEFRKSIEGSSMDELLKIAEDEQKSNEQKRQSIFEMIKDLENPEIKNKLSKEEINNIVRKASDLISSNDELCISAEHQTALASHMKPGKNLKDLWAKVSLSFKGFMKINEELQKNSSNPMKKMKTIGKLIKFLAGLLFKGTVFKVSKKMREMELGDPEKIALLSVRLAKEKEGKLLNQGYLKMNARSEKKDVIRYVKYDGSKVLDKDGREIKTKERNTLQNYLFIKQGGIQQIANFFGAKANSAESAKIAEQIVRIQKEEYRNNDGMSDILPVMIKNIALLKNNETYKDKKEPELLKLFLEEKDNNPRNNMIDFLLKGPKKE